MVLLSRLIARLVGIVLLLAIALLGLAAAIFCIQGDRGTVSLPTLASDLRLPIVRHAVGIELHRLQAGGPVALVSLAAGVGAILLGLLLLIGVLVPVRERLVVLRRDPDGILGARRRALGQAASALAEQPRAVLGARAHVKPRRRRPGGRIKIRADHLDQAPHDEVAGAVRGSLSNLTESVSLHIKVHPRTRHGRVR